MRYVMFMLGIILAFGLGCGTRNTVSEQHIPDVEDAGVHYTILGQGGVSVNVKERPLTFRWAHIRYIQAAVYCT